MKHSLLATLTTAALVLPVAAFAVDSNVATGDITAEVISPLTITQNEPLNFGSFSPGTSAGLVYTNDTSPTGGIHAFTQGTAGTFDVTGNPGNTYNVTGPATTTIADGANSMNVDLTYPAGAQDLDSETGLDTFPVNGTLHVNANQAPGSYDGTYNVTVNY